MLQEHSKCGLVLGRIHLGRAIARGLFPPPFARCTDWILRESTSVVIVLQRTIHRDGLRPYGYTAEAASSVNPLRVVGSTESLATASRASRVSSPADPTLC